jgi:uncharacterized protein YjbI with pentapeptide repeats
MIADADKEYRSQHFVRELLPETRVSDTVFEDCEFRDCDFHQTAFAACRFVDCSFMASNLSLITVAQCRFTAVEFHDCKVIGVNWPMASWPRLLLASPLAFQRCIISDSSFLGLCFDELILQACKAHDVDFRDGRFARARFVDTDFTHSLFGRTALAGADFTGAWNYDIDVLENDVKHAKFSRDEALRLLQGLDIEIVD